MLLLKRHRDRDRPPPTARGTSEGCRALLLPGVWLPHHVIHKGLWKWTWDVEDPQK